VHPLNFREEDKPILDALFVIAKKQGSDLTGVIRTALQEYTMSKLKTLEASRMDDFLGDALIEPSLSRLLTPVLLMAQSDSDLLRLARLIRARRQEVGHEVERRGYHFLW
jgi:hypothetical protein